MIVGTGLTTVAYFYLSQINVDWEIWQVSIGMVLLGLGIGQLLQTLTISSQNAVEAKDIGVATSSSTFFRQIGGTLGVAAFLSVLFSTVADKTNQVAEGIKQAITLNPELMSDPRNEMLLAQDPSSLDEMITTDSSFLETISPELAYPIRQAFAEAASDVFFAATFVVILGFIVSFFVKELELRTKSGVQEMAEGA